MSIEGKGRGRNVAIAATAGNVDTELSPGLGKRWKVEYGIIAFVADATVDNRYINQYIQDVDDHDIGPKMRHGTAIAASQTKYFGLWNKDIGDWADSKGSTLINMEDVVAVVDIIDGNNKLVINISSGKAGDSYSGYLVVEEI